MTEKKTVQWMKDEGYYDRWVLPQHDTALHGIDCKIYRGRPTGNSPEMMPWDASLNKDVHECVDKHIALTAKMDREDPKKLSLATPTTGAWAYMQVVDPDEGMCPSSKRIVEDTIRCYGESPIDIIKCQGCVIPGTTKQVGHRRANVADNPELKSNNWGGKRERKEDKRIVYLPAVEGVLDQKVAASKAKFDDEN